MLPSVRPFLKFIDAENQVKSYGFTEKVSEAVISSRDAHDLPPIAWRSDQVQSIQTRRMCVLCSVARH